MYYKTIINFGSLRPFLHAFPEAHMRDERAQKAMFF